MSTTDDIAALEERSVVVRSSEQTHRELGEEFVILGISSGRYFSVEDVAATIWRALEHPVEVARLCEEVVAYHETTLEECRADVMAFLRQLRSEKLLTVLKNQS